MDAAEDQVIGVDAGLVDLDRRRVLGPDRDEALTATEERLLRRLVEAGGEVVARDELLREVWGFHPDVVSRTLDSTVARLRRKLERDPTDPRSLLTAPRVGYRLVIEPWLPRPGLLAAIDDAARQGFVWLWGLPGAGCSHLALRWARQRVPDERLLVAPVREVGPTLALAALLRVPPEGVATALEARRVEVLVLDRLEPTDHEEARALVRPGSIVITCAHRPPPLGSGVEVPPLGRALSRSLFLRHLARPLAPDRIDALLASARGLPRSIRLLAARPEAGEAPLQDPVRAVLHTLGEDARAAARVAPLFPEPFEVAVLAEVAGLPEPRGWSALGELGRYGLATGLRGTRWCFQALDEGTVPEEAVARALAVWFVEGSRVARARDRAGGDSAAVALLDDVGNMLAAVRAGETRAPDLAVEVLLTFATPLMWAGGIARLVPRVEALWAADLAPSTRAGLLAQRASIARWSGRPEEALSLGRQVLADPTAPPAARITAVNAVAHGLIASRARDQAVALLEEERARHPGNVHLDFALAVALVRADPERALALTDGICAGPWSLQIRGKALSLAGRLAAEQGRHVEAEAKLEAAIATFHAADDRMGVATARLNLAAVSLVNGGMAVTADRMERALEAGREAGYPSLVASASLGLALAALDLGDRKRVEASLAAIREPLAAPEHVCQLALIRLLIALDDGRVRDLAALLGEVERAAQGVLGWRSRVASRRGDVVALSEGAASAVPHWECAWELAAGEHQANVARSAAARLARAAWWRADRDGCDAWLARAGVVALAEQVRAEREGRPWPAGTPAELEVRIAARWRR